MAQKTEKEDAAFKTVPGTLTSCINNCDASTNNNAAALSSSSSGSAPFHFGTEPPKSSEPDVETRIIPSRPKPQTHNQREVKRCTGCRRKVGLTGFRCRCGNVFCAVHRYSDRHECSYDYKASGKAAIARENPVVKAAKIVMI